MRWFVRCAVTASVVAACTTWAAEPKQPAEKGWQDRLTFTLSDRVRGEFVDWFQPALSKAPAGAHRYDFLANQLRPGLRLELPHLLVVVEGQDTRLVNLPDDASAPNPSKAGNLGPGALYYANTRSRDQGESFLKQGYATVKDLPGLAGISLTAGRFDYSDGLETIPADAALAWVKRARVGERLIGPFGFTHVTRSLDGVKLVYDQPSFNLTALGSRPTAGGFEVSANRELGIYVAGLAATLKQIEGMTPLDARLFYLYYRDNRDHAAKVDNRAKAVREADRKDIEVHTLGSHAVTVVEVGPGKADGLLWGALQAGDWGQLDHFAWAYAVEGGYQFPKVPASPWVRLGYNRSSGDDDGTDQIHHTFMQLIPTARAYAQFPFYNLMNSEDLFAQLIVKPTSTITIRSDYHWLRATNSADLWYSGGGATSPTFFGYAGLPTGGNRELAHLLDLGITVAVTKQVTAYGYCAHAFGQGIARSTYEGASANYGYVELTYRY
ncbi:MAG: alginate export family protein [Deltaproteobacteria bacterium]|nr:alginate export family protein [Deltaproteobacteria bacterium]